MALRVKADGSLVYEPITVFDQTLNQYVPVSIDLGPPEEQVFLILFGTGIRARSSLTAVNLTVGGEIAEVNYAGPQNTFVGLDQINGRLSRNLAGRGEVDVDLSVDRKAANVVRVKIN